MEKNKRQDDVRRRKAWRPLLAVMLCIAAAFCTADPKACSAEEEKSDRIIVSLGDSYSSGEGNPPFYGQDLSEEEKVKDEDWLAHRSRNSWGGMLKLPGVEGDMADNRNTHWIFAAASGAETQHLYLEQRKDYSRANGIYVIRGLKKLLNQTNDGTEWLPAQLDVFNPNAEAYQMNGRKADYVTITMGGNDLGFADIVETMVYNTRFSNPDKLADKLEYAEKKLKEGVDGDISIREKLKVAYQRIAESAGSQARIIVVGYPLLFAEIPKTDNPGSKVQTIGQLEENERSILRDDECRRVNEKVEMFNGVIADVVKELEGTINICYVDVQEEFRGHGVYSEDPWINGLDAFANDQDLDNVSIVSAYSIHPNEKGCEAYARCVQAKINELEGVDLKINAKVGPDVGSTAQNDLTGKLNAELSGYLLTDIDAFAGLAGGMTPYGDDPGYRNGELSVEGFSSDRTIRSITIEQKCGYRLFGFTVGMPYSFYDEYTPDLVQTGGTRGGDGYDSSHIFRTTDGHELTVTYEDHLVSRVTLTAGTNQAKLKSDAGLYKPFLDDLAVWFYVTSETGEEGAVKDIYMDWDFAPDPLFEGDELDYAFYDINRDGIYELLVTRGESLCCLLTLEDGKPKILTNSWYNNRVTIDAEGNIYMEGRESNSEYSVERYILEGTELKLQDCIFSIWLEDGVEYYSSTSLPWDTADAVRITEAEYEQLSKEYAVQEEENGKLKPEIRPLVGYFTMMDPNEIQRIAGTEMAADMLLSLAQNSDHYCTGTEYWGNEVDQGIWEHCREFAVGDLDGDGKYELALWKELYDGEFMRSDLQQSQLYLYQYPGLGPQYEGADILPMNSFLENMSMIRDANVKCYPCTDEGLKQYLADQNTRSRYIAYYLDEERYSFESDREKYKELLDDVYAAYSTGAAMGDFPWYSETLLNKWGGGHFGRYYSFVDLDGDGNRELFLHTGSLAHDVAAIYTWKDGQPIFLLEAGNTDSDGYIYRLHNMGTIWDGTIAADIFNSATGDSGLVLYRVSGGQAVIEDGYIGEAPEYYGLNYDLSADMNRPLSEAEVGDLRSRIATDGLSTVDCDLEYYNR